MGNPTSPRIAAVGELILTVSTPTPRVESLCWACLVLRGDVHRTRKMADEVKLLEPCAQAELELYFPQAIKGEQLGK
jgi:hypothetical protein